MRNYIIIIFLVLFSICCYFLYQQSIKKKRITSKPIISNNEDLMIESSNKSNFILENFSNEKDLCFMTPALISVNYDNSSEYQTKFINKEKSKYYIEGADQDATQDSKYFYLVLKVYHGRQCTVWFAQASCSNYNFNTG